MFAWWMRVHQRFPSTTWTDFLEWELWQIGAAVGLDRIEASETELAWLEEYESASSKLPSSERRG